MRGLACPLEHGSDVDPPRAADQITDTGREGEASGRHTVSGVGGRDPDSLEGVTAPELGGLRAMPAGAGPVSRLSASALRHNIPAARARGRGVVSPLPAAPWGPGAGGGREGRGGGKGGVGT